MKREEEVGMMRDDEVVDLEAMSVAESAGDYGAEPIPLKGRTREFALRIIRLYGALPKSAEAQVIGKQALRSGTSVGAHYREGMRARSDAEAISKLEGGLQELEETQYWLELLIGANILPANRLNPPIQESNQLIAIFTTCAKRIKERSKK
jgi:four helix bundle protein